MTTGAIRRDTERVASEATRARKRAAFIATIRRASQVDVAAARPATRPVAPPAPRPQTGLATRPEPRLPTRPGKVARETVREVAPVEQQPRRAKASTQIVEAPKPAANLFRAEALKHRLSSEEGRGLVRVSPPWTWALLWIVVCALGASIAASFIGKVEVTSRGRGILRPTTGVRALTSQLTGVVTRIDARSGDRVKAGTALLRIESPSVQAELLEAERQLQAVRTQYSTVSVQQDQHYAEQIEHLKARSKKLTEEIASLKSSEGHFQRRVQADLGLLKKGLVSELAVSDTRDALAQAQRQLNGGEQALDQTRQELASLESRRQDELWQRQQTVSAAQNKRDSLALVLQQSVIQAPTDGAVEGLLVRVGESVQAGQVVGKLIPVESPLHVISFLAEKDRAFAKAGDEVQLELDQLPHAEFGTLRAQVVRISDDLASPFEIREALGEDQKLESPSYRVELEITDAGPADAAGVKLRTGTLLNARYTLRRQRLATLVLNPLRKWFR